MTTKLKWLSRNKGIPLTYKFIATGLNMCKLMLAWVCELDFLFWFWDFFV